MGALTCLVSAGFVWIASWVLLGRESTGGTWASARLRFVVHGVQRVFGRIAESTLCVRALAWQPFRAVADELCGRMAKHGMEESLDWCGAALLVSMVLCCAVVGIIVWSFVGVLVAAPLVICAIPLRSAYLARLRHRQMAEQMPDVFRTLATALSSGQTLMQAIDYVGLHEGGPTAGAFCRASLRLRCGVSAEDALNSLASELDVPGAGLMACALSISQRTGSPLKDLFQRSARLVEQQGELERTLAVRTAQVRLSVRIVCMLPVAMVMLLSLISADFREGLVTPIGMGCLMVGALFDGLALLLIRSILKGVL